MRLIDADAFRREIDNHWPFTKEEQCKHGVADMAKSTLLYVLNIMPTIEQPHWIPCSERLPEITEPVNITWVNRKPAIYYADIKDKPYTDTGIYCNGKWWWYSVSCKDYLDEYGKSPGDDMDEAIEVLAWMPLPEPAGLEGE